MKELFMKAVVVAAAVGFSYGSYNAASLMLDHLATLKVKAVMAEDSMTGSNAVDVISEKLLGNKRR